MELRFRMGTGEQRVCVPDENLMDVLHSNPVEAPASEEAEILRALQNPIGTSPLRELIRPGETVAIITSDITRPMPTSKVMPLVLDELYTAGVRREDITLVFALGSHRSHTPQEQRKLAGERAWQEITCVDSDPEDCVCLGVTRAGTPVEITRVVARADHRICLGNIEFHYFAGYSGGRRLSCPVSPPERPFRPIIR